MDYNTDFMVFRENDEYDIKNEIQKDSDLVPVNDNVDDELKFIKDKQNIITVQRKKSKES